jgi:hypothetical protein
MLASVMFFFPKKLVPHGSEGKEVGKEDLKNETELVKLASDRDG